MVALARLLGIAFVVLTIVYVALSLYSRSKRRQKLERAWDEESLTGDREGYIQDGLDAYDASLRRKLILGVYIVPLGIVVVIVYLTNFY